MSKQNRNRYFIDIDGTLAIYISKEYAWWEIDGIFRYLQPQERVLKAVKTLIHNNEEVYIITAYHKHTPQVKADKIFWLEQYLPEIKLDHQIYTLCGEDKTAYIPNGVKSTDILLDDFNRNLENWRDAGGISIKLLNGLNSKESWDGEYIYSTDTENEIAEMLIGTTFRKANVG